MIRFRRFLLVLSMAGLLALVAGAASAAMNGRPINLPGPVPIPDGITDEQAAKAIKTALIGRGWAITKESPGVIEGTLNLRQHMLRENFAYTGRQVVITYVDSSELDYHMEGTTVYVHPKVTNWTANVVLDMNVEFARLRN